MNLNRRGFLGTLLAGIAGTAATQIIGQLPIDDPEKLLWSPDQKTIFIPGVSDAPKIVLADTTIYRPKVQISLSYGTVLKEGPPKGFMELRRNPLSITYERDLLAHELMRRGGNMRFA